MRTAKFYRYGNAYGGYGRSSISQRLKKWRGVRDSGNGARGKFTQREAAEKIGVAFKTYVKWETGERTPRGIAMDAILERIK